MTEQPVQEPRPEPRPVVFEEADYQKARKNLTKLTLEDLQNAALGGMHRGLMANSFAPKDYGPIFVSRDWDMEGRIECACKECLANDGKGKCVCPSLVKMNSKGKCSGYQVNSKPKSRKKKK